MNGVGRRLKQLEQRHGVVEGDPEHVIARTTSGQVMVLEVVELGAPHREPSGPYKDAIMGPTGHLQRLLPGGRLEILEEVKG